MHNSVMTYFDETFITNGFKGRHCDIKTSANSNFAIWAFRQVVLQTTELVILRPHLNASNFKWKL